MKTVAAALLLFLVPSWVACTKVRYDNYEVYRVVPRTPEAVDALRYLEETSDSFEFWSEIAGVDRPVDVMVAPHARQKFLDIVAYLALDSEIFIPNVQDLIDKENPDVARRATSYDWTAYLTLDEINDWLRQLAEDYPDQVSLRVGGTTYEGRDILGVYLNFGVQAKTVFIESNIHAREWITSATATYFINQLVTSQDPAVRAIADTRDWYIFPVTNPDGFVYSHTTERLWRKTRVPYPLCNGADPNRNWAYQYNNGGTSNNPCSQTYRGPTAFSEPSTKSLSEYISTLGPQLEAYISLHSYSQLFLIPYGHTLEQLDNYAELKEVALVAATSLAQRYGTQYLVGNIPEVLYIASGGSMDWVKGTYGTRITYTYELRDTGTYGFILPADQIIPTAEETVDSLITIFEEFDRILQEESETKILNSQEI